MRPVIGHTILFTSEKKNRIGFPAFRRCFPKWKCSQLSLLPLTRSWFSRFADIISVEQFIEDQENENTKKKTQQNVAGISDAEERVKTYGRNSPKGAECIHERIYHYGTKEREQRRL